jgi:hypothetical protein
MLSKYGILQTQGSAADTELAVNHSCQLVDPILHGIPTFTLKLVNCSSMMASSSRVSSRPHTSTSVPSKAIARGCDGGRDTLASTCTHFTAIVMCPHATPLLVNSWNVSSICRLWSSVNGLHGGKQTWMQTFGKLVHISSILMWRNGGCHAFVLMASYAHEVINSGDLLQGDRHSSNQSFQTSLCGIKDLKMQRCVAQLCEEQSGCLRIGSELKDPLLMEAWT